MSGKSNKMNKLVKSKKSCKGNLTKTKKLNKTSKIEMKKTKSIKPLVESSKTKKKKTVGNIEDSYQKQMVNLKKVDPEFYDFLKKNDKKLLEFDLYDDEISEDDIGNSETKNKTNKEGESVNGFASEEDEEEDKCHKLKGELEVASDESDFENDATTENLFSDYSQKITLSLLRQWQLELENPKVSVDVIRNVIRAFSSTLASVSPDIEETSKSTNTNASGTFKVIGAPVFNGVIQLCVLNLHSALVRYLGISKKSPQLLHKTKKWPKVRSCIRCYLTDLTRLIEFISNSNILSVLLKHLHQMAAMVVPFSQLSKNILKRLVVLWSSADEIIRVVSFLCILKITRNQQGAMLNHVLHAMYLSYIRNSKFVSPHTLPAINFMRRSLVEMFSLDLNTSYRHAFLYIRQLAIHLRNAIILKKDSFQAVYNWQYVNSLRLWSDLLASTHDKEQLKPLVYPYVTITIGVIRLIPTAKYFPLRFHCLQSLITLAKGTNTFIPVLPLILETLRSKTFQQKYSVVSMKPLQFTCVLRLTKNQLAENGFRDEVVEQVYALSLEYLAHESASLAFSDLVVPAVMSLKAYFKQCHNANYIRKLKQLMDKILENARFIDAERRKINFALTDTVQIHAWEAQIYNKGTPLNIFYNNWLKMHEIKKRRLAAQSDDINDGFELPLINKHQNKLSANVVTNSKGEVELFPSDTDESHGDDNGRVVESGQKEEVPKKKLKKVKKSNKKHIIEEKSTTNCGKSIEEENIDEQIDIVKDLDLNDW